MNIFLKTVFQSLLQLPQRSVSFRVEKAWHSLPSDQLLLKISIQGFPKSFDCFWTSCLYKICKHLLVLNVIFLHVENFQKAEEGEHISSGQLGAEVSTQDIWLEKAEVCLSLGLYQSTRQLLGEAHMVAKVSEKNYVTLSMFEFITSICKLTIKQAFRS